MRQKEVSIGRFYTDHCFARENVLMFVVLNNVNINVLSVLKSYWEHTVTQLIF